MLTIACPRMQPIPLEECVARDHPRDDLGFQVAHRGGSVNVRAGSARQALAWTKAIDAARAGCIAAIQKRRMSRQGV